MKHPRPPDAARILSQRHGDDLFVDADVIELFIDERYALSTRLPRGDRPVGIRIIAQPEATATIEGTLYRLE